MMADHGTVHALITWLSCTDHVTVHALMTWLGHTDVQCINFSFMVSAFEAMMRKKSSIGSY